MSPVMFMDSPVQEDYIIPASWPYLRSTEYR